VLVELGVVEQPDAVKEALERIDRFSSPRLHSEIGYVPRQSFEAGYYAPPEAAGIH
jgi:hypothetical protein